MRGPLLAVNPAHFRARIPLYCKGGQARPSFHQRSKQFIIPTLNPSPINHAYFAKPHQAFFPIREEPLLKTADSEGMIGDVRR